MNSSEEDIDQNLEALDVEYRKKGGRRGKSIRRVFTKGQVQFIMRTVETMVDRKLTVVAQAVQTICAKLGIQNQMPRLKILTESPHQKIQDFSFMQIIDADLEDYREVKQEISETSTNNMGKNQQSKSDNKSSIFDDMRSELMRQSVRHRSWRAHYPRPRRLIPCYASYTFDQGSVHPEFKEQWQQIYGKMKAMIEKRRQSNIKSWKPQQKKMVLRFVSDGLKLGLNQGALINLAKVSASAYNRWRMCYKE